MIEQIDYKTLRFGDSIIVAPKRIWQFDTFAGSILVVLLVAAKKTDPEYEDLPIGRNAYCYDSTGQLVWRFYLKGVTGMQKNKWNDKQVYLYENGYEHLVNVLTGDPVETKWVK